MPADSKSEKKKKDEEQKEREREMHRDMDREEENRRKEENKVYPRGKVPGTKDENVIWDESRLDQNRKRGRDI